MKKIFSAALALVCVWFASPALAVCENLYKTQNGTAAYLSTDCSAASYSSYLTTDFIPIEANTTYTFYSELTTTLSGHAMRICFYDSDKNKVGNRGGGDVSAVGHYAFTHTSPSNAAYIRVSSYQPGVALINPIIIKGDYSGHEAYDQCYGKIQIATTKYNESAFGPLNTALANAISVVDTVVSNTITHAGRIATLQTQKQTRPNDIADDNEKCPAGKKCLLVEDASGIPHWYEIVERYSRLPDGYTELQWIESTGTQYIDTGVTGPARWVGAAQSTSVSDKSQCILGADYVNNSAYSASVYLASQVGSSGVVWRLSSALSTVATTDYAEYDVNFAETSFSGTINGESLSASGVSGFTNWYIGMDRGSSSIYYFIGKIYTQKAYQNNTLIRDFVPAKNPDGKIGMYDLVGGRFYENAGEGSFIAGDPVSE